MSCVSLPALVCVPVFGPSRGRRSAWQLAGLPSHARLVGFCSPIGSSCCGRRDAAGLRAGPKGVLPDGEQANDSTDQATIGMSGLCLVGGPNLTSSPLVTSAISCQSCQRVGPKWTAFSVPYEVCRRSRHGRTPASLRRTDTARQTSDEPRATEQTAFPIRRANRRPSQWTRRALCRATPSNP